MVFKGCGCEMNRPDLFYNFKYADLSELEGIFQKYSGEVVENGHSK